MKVSVICAVLLSALSLNSCIPAGHGWSDLPNELGFHIAEHIESVNDFASASEAVPHLFGRFNSLPANILERVQQYTAANNASISFDQSLGPADRTERIFYNRLMLKNSFAAGSLFKDNVAFVKEIFEIYLENADESVQQNGTIFNQLFGSNWTRSDAKTLLLLTLADQDFLTSTNDESIPAMQKFISRANRFLAQVVVRDLSDDAQVDNSELLGSSLLNEQVFGAAAVQRFYGRLHSFFTEALVERVRSGSVGPAVELLNWISDHSIMGVASFGPTLHDLIDNFKVLTVIKVMEPYVESKTPVPEAVLDSLMDICPLRTSSAGTRYRWMQVLELANAYSPSINSKLGISQFPAKFLQKMPRLENLEHAEVTVLEEIMRLKQVMDDEHASN